MASHLLVVLTLLTLCSSTPLLSNVSMDGSGDEAELELLFPTSMSTKAPAHSSVSTETPSLTNTLSTTMTRLKDFVLSRVVDFLQDNLIIIIVVMSLLVVMVFIICCAFAMSHKRKLEADKPPPPPSRKYTSHKPATRKDSGDAHERRDSMDHVKRVHNQSGSSPKHLRTPSKALVGEAGRDVKWSRKVRDTEEAERRREEPKHREQTRYKEEGQPSPHSSPAHPVCTCHLKKGHH